MRNFWQQLSLDCARDLRPFFVLAPMANVTDPVFRQIIAKHGKPDVMYTEFISCDGLVSEGRDRLIGDLRFTEKERPIVAQFFGSKPEHFTACAKLAVEFGFDGIDINMGCPDKSVEKQGAGAALIKNPVLAREIIRATKKGADGLPVSIKTRIGYSKNEVETWIPELLAESPAALIVHARTRREMSKVSADWSRIKRVVELARGSGTLIIGNGDVESVEEGRERAHEAGCDGIMIGRGIFHNPWIFSHSKANNWTLKVHARKRLALALEHTKLFDATYKGERNFATMKKFYKMYASGFDGAKELRIKLMETDSASDVIHVLEEYLTLNFKQQTSS